MFRHFFILSLLFCINLISVAEQSFLQNNSDASISEDIVLKLKEKSCSYTIRYSITLYNSNQKELAGFLESYDKHTAIKFISGNISDKYGKILKSIKKSDLSDVSSQSEFASDARILYYDPPVNNYSFPVTVEYVFEINQNFVLNIQPWIPVKDFGIHIKSSTYSIICNNEKDIRYLEKNNAPPVSKQTENGQLIYSWSLKDYLPVKKQELMPPILEITPHVLIAPSKLSYDNNENVFNDWKDFGKWINQLNKSKNLVPEALKSKVLEITKDKTSIEEKAKAVYEFVQNTTRYVSIQFGIGGFQPASVEKVYNTGYGDCKALVNYTTALLNAINIPAYYTLVLAGRHKNIQKEFPSNQFNHVILCLPLKNDTIWLECTSQKIAFGFLGEFTDDRDVLVISDQPFITHTKKYTALENTESSHAVLNIYTNGDASGILNMHKTGLNSEYLSYINDELSPNEKLQKISDLLEFKNIEIDSFKITIKKEVIPSASLQVNLKSREYGTTSSSRIFLPMISYQKFNWLVQEDTLRNHPFYIYSTFTSNDTIDFYFPNEFKLETKESSTVIDSEFGTYSYSINYNNNMIRYIRNIKINSGKYDAIKYKQLYTFFKDASLKDGLKLMLKRI